MPWENFYFAKNLQGDVTALYRNDYNSSTGTYYATLVATYTYDPYGNPTSIKNAAGATISQSAANIAAYNPFRYRGYRYDADTGFYYLQSRYYDPELGRFINADTFASTGLGIIGCNMFAYCNNNPTIYADTDGQFIGFLIAGVALFCCAAVSITIVNSPPVQTAIRGLADAIGNATRNLITDTIESIEGVVARATEAKKSKKGAGNHDNVTEGAAKGALNQPDDNENKLSLKHIQDKFLKKLGLDAHSIKQEYLGSKANISRYDLAYDTKTGIIYIITKAGKIVAETYYNIYDIMLCR